MKFDEGEFLNTVDCCEHVPLALLRSDLRAIDVELADLSVLERLLRRLFPLVSGRRSSLCLRITPLTVLAFC